jgi:lytic murein transglycosylase
MRRSQASKQRQLRAGPGSEPVGLLPLSRSGLTGALAAVAFAVVLAGSCPAVADDGDFRACLASMRAEAMSRGVSIATFDAITAKLVPNDAATFLDVQPEFSTPVWDYLAGLVDAERVSDGMEAIRRWDSTLRSAQARFGVDKATIAAVWGVESNYGRQFGKRPVLQSLATLSCAGRRQNYFRTEFIDALSIVDRGEVSPDHFFGSWAGAFGHTQFMPSTFLRFAIDMEGHGRPNIVDSIPDALGSTANYLRKAGWQPGLPWGFEVRVPAAYSGPSGRRNKASMATWAKRGITRVAGGSLGSGTAGLLQPAGPDGPAFLVTPNFDVLLTYNSSESYALAISILSDRLRGRPDIVASWPTSDPGLSRVERRELQTLLVRRGYDLGDADGVMGDKTHAAIMDFQARVGLPPDGRAAASVLAALRAGH